jgi:hypothetical protein
MRSYLDKHKTAIMISVVTSRVPIDRPDLVDQWGELLKHGLQWVLACPFPVANPEIAKHLPRLNGYYSRSYGWARELSTKMEQMFGKAGRVDVFTLKASTQTTLVIPPLRVTDMRPAFIKYSEVKTGGNITLPARHACGAYIRFTDGRPDRWLDIYNGGEMNERVEEAYGIWADYLSEIADNWAPTTNGPIYDENRMRFWERLEK